MLFELRVVSAGIRSIRENVKWQFLSFRRSAADLLLFEDSKVTKQPPQDDEYDDSRAAAATGHFPCTIPGGDAAQQFAHFLSTLLRESVVLMA